MFFNSLGTIDIDCDAPPYTVVQASRALDLRTPEDVRWCHTRNAPRIAPKQRLGWFWKALFQKPEPTPAVCCCGRELPELNERAFTLAPGETVHFLLGQCRRCCTIFWKER